ncbi:MAG: cell division protein ZapA [Betaproteobacteria bacterium]|nr:MAG: cell division protein ZapA [Betaproteobacteria bacterium]
MAESSNALEVVVRGRTFRVNAPTNERAALAAAIATVQTRCDAIAAKQSSADSERVLLLAALELAASAPATALTSPEATSDVSSRLDHAANKLDAALRSA